MYVVIN